MTKNKVKDVIDKIEKKLTVVQKMAIGGLVLFISFVALTAVLPEKNDPVASSVMIVESSGVSGGSGVILRSATGDSEVLTNAHVCDVVRRGGMVLTKASSYMISAMRYSMEHDLCLINVMGDLGVETDIASSAPKQYYEKATVSGHPALYPNVVTSGHFSGTEVIPVLIGFERCTGKEKGQDLFMCGYFGGMPLIRRYETTLVTATIMPGSSGSGVYNTNEELTGLVFAGSGGLGYAWTVPYEYLKFFIEVEAHSAEYVLPQTTFRFSELKQNKFDISVKCGQIEKIKNPEHKKVAFKICKEVKQLPLYGKN